MTLSHRTYGGRVNYVGDSTGPRGREWFTVTVQPDGQRTLRARSEIDDAGILRDVTYTVDRAWRPVDAFVRVGLNGQYSGSGWYRFDGRVGWLEGHSPGSGRIRQRLEHAADIRTFNSHAVVADLWHFAALDWRDGESVRRVPIVTASPLPDGGSGPSLSTIEVGLRHVGPDEVETAAGRFACERFRFEYDNGWPDQDAWCTADDLVLVRMRWDLTRSTYELVEFTPPTRPGQ